MTQATTRPYDAVLYGATGFTGKLIAAQLQKRGLAFAVAGRNEEKLRALSAALASRPPVITAAADDPAALKKMAAQARVLVSAAGPFVEMGLPVAQAAVAAKTHYLDTTGEQAFVRLLAETLDGPAREAGVVVAPSLGFDVTPGDVAAWLAASALGGGKPAPCRRVRLVYHVEAGVLTRGTIRSLLGVMASPGFTFRRGAWVNAASGETTAEVVFPGETQKRRAILTPLAEVVTVARALPVQNVETLMVVNPLEELVMRHGGKLLGPLRQQPSFEKLLDRAIDHLPEGPEPADREEFHWRILARAEGVEGGVASVTASGCDTYGLTGELLSLYAALAAKPGFKKAGVLSPCQLAPPLKTLAGLRDFPIEFTSSH